MSLVEEIQATEIYSPEWVKAPDMSILQSSCLPAPELPMQVFGTLVDWLSQAAEVKNAPVDYIAVGLLSISASLIGNTRYVSPWSGWKEPSILWLVSIGRPSSGKSPALDAVLEPLRVLQKELQSGYNDKKLDYETQLEASKEEKKLWEKELKEAVQQNNARPPKPSKACEPSPPILPRLFINDVTIEELGLLLRDNPRGLLMTRDELAGWLAGMGRYSTQGSERAFWIEAFGGRSYTFDRVKHHNDPVIIKQLAVSMIGGIQPDRLAKVFFAGDDDGLPARFLYVWPEPMPPKRPNVKEDQSLILYTFERLYGLKMPEEPEIMCLTEEASELFEQFRRKLSREEEACRGLLLGHIGKLPGITLRLALVLELLCWASSREAVPPADVSQSSLLNACKLVYEYFLPMARRAFGDAALPESEKNVTSLARWIYRCKPEKVNIRDLSRKNVLGVRETEPYRAALEEMQELGWVWSAPSRAGKTIGRKRGDYLVNPSIWDAG